MKRGVVVTLPAAVLLTDTVKPEMVYWAATRDPTHSAPSSTARAGGERLLSKGGRGFEPLRTKQT